MNKLPKEWSDVATGQFIELTRILERSYSTELDRNIDLLATLRNTTRAEIEAMRINDIKADVRQTAFLSDISSMPTALPAFFTLKGKLYDVQLDITKITGYQLIDLMSFTRVPSEIPQNIHNIMAVMAIPRRYFWKKGSYSGDRHPQLAQLFYERLPITISRPLRAFFLECLEQLTGRYSGLFHRKATRDGVRDAEGDEEFETEQDPDSFENKYGWLITIDTMSNYDRTKWDFFGNMNVIEFLNCVSFHRQHQALITTKLKELKRNGR